MTDFRTTAIAAAALVGAGLAACGGLIAYGLIDARTGDRIVTVRGLAERDAKADLAILPLRFTQSGEDLAAVQIAIDGDIAKVRGFLAAQGFKPAEIDLGRLEVVDNNAREYGPQNVRARFILGQTINVRSNDVDRVQGATRNLSNLVRQGVVLQDFRGASYIFTKLNDVRPEMIRRPRPARAPARRSSPPTAARAWAASAPPARARSRSIPAIRSPTARAPTAPSTSVCAW
jgi:hypothetical protein